MQEAARAVLERQDSGSATFASPDHARNYFLRAVHSRALDVLRVSDRERAQPPVSAGEREAEGTDRPPPLEEHETRTLRTERMRRALEDLNPAQRQALGMRYLEGLSYREIAERVGASISTLQSRVEAGLERLRERMAGL